MLEKLIERLKSQKTIISGLEGQRLEVKNESLLFNYPNGNKIEIPYNDILGCGLIEDRYSYYTIFFIESRDKYNQETILKNIFVVSSSVQSDLADLKELVSDINNKIDDLVDPTNIL